MEKKQCEEEKKNRDHYGALWDQKDSEVNGNKQKFISGVWLTRESYIRR